MRQGAAMKTLEAQRARQSEQLRSMTETVQATETLKNDALGVLRQREGELHSERAKLTRMTQVSAAALWVVHVVRCVSGGGARVAVAIDGVVCEGGPRGGLAMSRDVGSV